MLRANSLVKSLRTNGATVLCTDKIIGQDARPDGQGRGDSSVSIGNRSMMFISTGDYWITYYCG